LAFGGSPEATRRAFNKRFLLDLAEDWQQHGRECVQAGAPGKSGQLSESLRNVGAGQD